MFELIPGAHISATALDAERTRMQAIANNLANVHSTAGDDGKVYQRRVPVFEAVFNDSMSDTKVSNLDGVKLKEIAKDDKAPVDVYAPYHPKADKKGMVQMPSISPMEEMMDMITSTRAYEANLNIINQNKQSAEKTINMFRGA